MLKQGQHTARPSGRWGFTLVEVLIVVAILALLVAVLVGVASSISTQRDTALTKNCLDILDAALAEFREITGKYPVDDWKDDVVPGTMDPVGSLIDGAEKDNPSDPDPNEDELLYLQLSILPQTRAIIAKLPSQLITAPISNATVKLAGQSENTPYLQSIVDAWGTPLNDGPGDPADDTTDPYDVFPRLWSSGPDGDSATTEDNIYK